MTCGPRRGLHAPVTSPDDLPEHVARNREHWDAMARRLGRRRAGAAGPRPSRAGGSGRCPESELRLLPDDLAGQDAIELGCGTAYVSAWLARRGARPVGIDNSAEQLGDRAGAAAGVRASTSRWCTATPSRCRTRTARFDFAISEYGAAIWCDPYDVGPGGGAAAAAGRAAGLPRQPHAAAAVRAGRAGAPAGDRLLRDYFGLHRLEWADDDSVEFAPAVRRVVPAAARRPASRSRTCSSCSAPAGATRDFTS